MVHAIDIALQPLKGAGGSFLWSYIRDRGRWMQGVLVCVNVIGRDRMKIESGRTFSPPQQSFCFQVVAAISILTSTVLTTR